MDTIRDVQDAYKNFLKESYAGELHIKLEEMIGDLIADENGDLPLSDVEISEVAFKIAEKHPDVYNEIAKKIGREAFWNWYGKEFIEPYLKFKKIP